MQYTGANCVVLAVGEMRVGAGMQKDKSTLTFCPAPGGSIPRVTDVKHTFSSLGRGKSAFCSPSHTQVLMIVLLKGIFVCPAVENRMNKGEKC